MNTQPDLPADRPHDWSAFIRANTRLLAPPLVPEIRLYLADESVPIWQKTEDQLGVINVTPPFWAFAWAGGQALARYVLDHPGLLAGKRVLDLGAGSGLMAIAAMHCAAKSALAADIDPIAVAATALNARVNGMTLTTTTANMLSGDLTGFDAILVGDLFYERSLAETVLLALDGAAASGAVVLVGDPQRDYFPKGRFTPLADYSVPVSREIEDAEIKPTTVWRLGS